MSRELAGPYDPELPILAELERALRARAGAEEAGAGAAAGEGGPDAHAAHAGGGGAEAAATGGGSVVAEGGRHGARRRRRAGVRAAVVLRRTALLASLSLLVGATAVATRSIVTGDGRGDPSLRATRAVELGSGAVAGERWSLSAARRGGELCHGFVAGGAVATRCAQPPPADGLVVDGLATPLARYVVGLAGARVETVVVRRGGVRAAARTRPLPTTTAALRAQVPRSVRWFVVALPPAVGRDAATVNAHGRGGAALGRPLLSCPRGVGERDCRPR